MHRHPSVELWCISLFKEYGKWYTGVLCVCVWYERAAKEYEHTRPRRTTEDEYSQSAHTQGQALTSFDTACTQRVTASD